MNIRFSNGLIYSWDKKNNPLIYNNGIVSIKLYNKKPIVACFAHGQKNYYIEVASGNWRVASNNKTWLLAVLDNFTGELSLQTTMTNPGNSYGVEFPLSPIIGDYFFHHLENRMFTWSGSKWINIIQVTIGSIENGKVFPENVGTQVALNKVVSPATIVKDESNLPILRFTDNGYHYFLTDKDVT